MDWSAIRLCKSCGVGNPQNAASCLRCHSGLLDSALPAFTEEDVKWKSECECPGLVDDVTPVLDRVCKHFAAYDKADISAEWRVLEGAYRVDACVSGKIVVRLAWSAFVDFGASLPGWFHIDAGVGFQEGELVSARIKTMEKGRRTVELTQVKRANQAPEDTARKLADPKR